MEWLEGSRRISPAAFLVSSLPPSTHSEHRRQRGWARTHTYTPTRAAQLHRRTYGLRSSWISRRRRLWHSNYVPYFHDSSWLHCRRAATLLGVNSSISDFDWETRKHSALSAASRQHYEKRNATVVNIDGLNYGIPLTTLGWSCRQEVTSASSIHVGPTGLSQDAGKPAATNELFFMSRN